jgi:hypothetical protein
MSSTEDDKFSFNLFVPKSSSSVSGATTNSASKTVAEPMEVITVDSIVLNIYLKHSYVELEAFVDELMGPNENLRVNATEQCVSTLHRYAFISTRDPIDMSNQSVRTAYRPNLFTRKNDAFGPWNFNFLLDLLELDYQRDDAKKSEFPKVWNTTSTTKIRVNEVKKAAQQGSINEPVQQQQDDITLFDLLKTICRQNKCDESDANIWLRALKGISILGDISGSCTEDIFC